jgi:GTP-binding protein
VAFGGRSNVGKSSLLNRLIGSPEARVSKRPGRTRGVFFYESGLGWVAADLPGYGFGRASRAERERWEKLASALFERGRPSLTAQLIDPRIPISESDLEFRDYLRALTLPSICVATKADRMSRSERAGASRTLGREFGELLYVSSKTGEGIDTLRNHIRRALA